MEKNTMKFILIGAVLLIVFGMNDTVPKEAVADVDGKSCTADDDCPCWGTYDDGSDDGIPSYGIGISSCHTCTAGDTNLTACTGKAVGAKVCDTTWCYDVEPVAEWARDTPWQWMKENTMVVAGIVGVIIVLMFWPKA